MAKMSATRLRLASFCQLLALATSWEDWWTYDGFSGPDFWGMVNLDWKVCAKGKQQSPINIQPKNLLFDPNLKSFHVNKNTVNGLLVNMGQRLVFSVAENVISPDMNVYVENGPLGHYKYKFAEVHFHFGEKNDRGSEHTIDEQRFPAEVQILAYNVDLTHNLSSALRMPNGVLMISILAWHGKHTSPELQRFTHAVPNVLYKGQKVSLQGISLHRLLPSTQQYVTYQGSVTFPGCYETATWIVVNKPLYISEEDLQRLRDIHQTTSKHQTPMLMANNFRPIREKETGNRLVRTNINFQTKGVSKCATTYKDMTYTINPSSSWPKSNRLS